MQLVVACAERRKPKKVAKVTNAIRAMGSSIDGFEDKEIRVGIKFTLDTCGCGKEQQNLAEI